MAQIKFGKIRNVTKTNLKTVSKDKPLVYKILTGSGAVQKFGRAKMGRGPKRIRESVQEIKDKGRQARKFAIKTTSSVAEAKRLESVLIRKLKPPFNKEEKGK